MRLLDIFGKTGEKSNSVKHLFWLPGMFSGENALSQTVGEELLTTFFLPVSEIPDDACGIAGYSGDAVSVLLSDFSSVQSFYNTFISGDGFQTAMSEFGEVDSGAWLEDSTDENNCPTGYASYLSYKDYTGGDASVLDIGLSYSETNPTTYLLTFLYEDFEGACVNYENSSHNPLARYKSEFPFAVINIGMDGSLTENESLMQRIVEDHICIHHGLVVEYKGWEDMCPNYRVPLPPPVLRYIRE